jgi:DNA-binding MarR family transcriptional regulator
MKFDKFVAKLKGTKDKFGLEPVELIILDEIVRRGEVTIMAFSDGFAQTSPMTTFKHIKNLTKRKLLKLEQSPTDGRVKLLREGAKFKELVKYLGES